MNSFPAGGGAAGAARRLPTRSLREGRPSTMSTLDQFAFGYAVAATGLQVASIALAARKCRKPRRRLAAAPDAPPVTVGPAFVRVETFSETTLEAAFALDYPDYELIFCLAHADDPAALLARRAMARHPDRKASLLVGDERPSANPKLNNVVKGWKAARNAWIIIANSNVLMPPDYIQRMMAGWRNTSESSARRRLARPPSRWRPKWSALFSTRMRRAGSTRPTPAASVSRKASRCCGGATSSRRAAASNGSATRSLKTLQRPSWSAAPTCGHASTAGPFDQPLGRRAWSEVWGRQARWARLRRATFPLFFAPELFTSGLLAIIAGAFGATAFGT